MEPLNFFDSKLKIICERLPISPLIVISERHRCGVNLINEVFEKPVTTYNYLLDIHDLEDSVTLVKSHYFLCMGTVNIFSQPTWSEGIQVCNSLTNEKHQVGGFYSGLVQGLGERPTGWISASQYPGSLGITDATRSNG
jgi:hypothetical protein